MKKTAWIGILFLMTSFPILGASSAKVTSPNGSESWALGTAHDITWTSQNPGSLVVNIVLRHIGGGLVGPIQRNVALSAGVLHWAVGKLEDGTMAPAGSDYIIRIRDAAGAVGDDSNGAFAIVAASPSGGEPDFAVSHWGFIPRVKDNAIQYVETQLYVKNNGADYTGPLTVHYIYLDALVNSKTSGDAMLTLPSVSIPSHTWYGFTICKAACPPGVTSISFSAMIDPGNLVKETAEGNNFDTKTYVIPNVEDIEQQ